MRRLLLDTSVLIAVEGKRPLAELPEGEAALSVVTLAELELGVHLAADPDARAARLATLARARDLYLGLPIDDAVASEFAALTAQLKLSSTRAPVQDTWIAATAIAHGAAVCTQDADFDPLAGIRGLEVVRV